MATNRTTKKNRPQPGTSGAHAYEHDHQAVQRPDAGLQKEFLKERHRPSKTYRYDSSLDPALSWSENPGRDYGEWLLGLIESCLEKGEEKVFEKEQVSKDGRIRVSSLKSSVAMLKTLSEPFLNWAGKAERPEIRVATLPLFVHEEHSTKAIIDGLSSHKAKGTNLDMFGDARLDFMDRLRAYEHKEKWANRMILGDSLLVMNSLLEYEGLGGQVQMIYIDPPYGVKFGSNFQPFVRRKESTHGKDEYMTREPEMVKAYRDTWELGLHSYLTYLRDRLLLAKELLTESGSVFVQISDDNLHHVREVMDEVFGVRNHMATITFKKTTGQTARYLSGTTDFVIWYSKDIEKVKYRPLYETRKIGDDEAYSYLQLPDGARRRLTKGELNGIEALPVGAKVFRLQILQSQRQGRDSGPGSAMYYPVEVDGRKFYPSGNRGWTTTREGMDKLLAAGRIAVQGNSISYVRFLNDFPAVAISNLWADTQSGSAMDKLYVVQTNGEIIKRAMLMTTDPGDLVLDPTCGSGTTAYVAEHWGRRWITIDTSRVPLALARQRLLTATYPYYELLDPRIGPRGGFVYKRKQNRKGEEVGGLVPHITLKSIANNEPPAMEVLVDRPEILKDVTRVTGTFKVEALMPAAIEIRESDDGAAPPPPPEEAVNEPGAEYDADNHIDRMVRILKLSKTLRLPGNRTLVFDNVRALDGYDYLHAEAQERDEDEKLIGVVFGPEDGAIGSETVYAAVEEAKDAGYAKLYFFGFAIQAKAREMIEDRSRKKLLCAFISMTTDIAMSDLLKTTRASEIFSVTGLPDIDVAKLEATGPDGAPLYQVRLKGLDIFNPATLDYESIKGEDLPCWMLDTDYNPLTYFNATQVFFPRTGAWDNLQKSLKVEFAPSVWEHLAGTESEPFALGERRRIAVKVIDERGNELMVVRDVKA